MTNAVISNLGVPNATAPSNYEEANALFMQEFTGEVIAAFDEMNVFMEKHMVRTISSGKSASFAHLGKANARYHVSGTPVLGNNKIKANETVIKIDDKLIADVFIDELEEAKNHYDVRSEYSKQLGASLSREADQRIARVLALTARSANPIDDLPGGARLENANVNTDADALTEVLFNAATRFDEVDAWEGERYGAFRPAQHYLLVQSKDAINSDWNGVGSFAEGSVPRVAGIELVKSNNIPTGNVAAVAGDNNAYNGDFRTTSGLVWQKQAAGTVKLMDLMMQKTGADFEAMYQGTMMVAKYAMGHGGLNPALAIEVATGPVA
ncbi:MAG: phage capsid protein [Pseudomonadota bacterium]